VGNPPAADCHTHPPTAPAETQDEALTVLLVDDQLIVYAAVKKVLAAHADLKLYHCRHGQKAVEHAKARGASLVLLDMVMPEVSGLEALAALRADEATRELPVIVMSSLEDPEEKAKAFAAGATDYVVKVPAEVELVARIRAHGHGYLRKLERDRAEQALAESRKQLLAAQKMRAIGELAGGMAHELNTPSQFIGDNLRFLRDAFSDLLGLAEAVPELVAAARAGSVPAELAEKVEGLLEEADLDFLRDEAPGALTQALGGIARISSIVTAVKEFAFASGGESPHPLDLNPEVETAARQTPEADTVALELALADGLPKVVGVPGELRQAIGHLVRNAVLAAKEGGGTVKVRTAAQDGAVILEVTDDGPGIGAETLPRIFEPFFTTREVGTGSGLGLALVYRVVHDTQGGRVDVETVPGKGSTFRVTLPVG